jgi:hypothetical protein
MITVRRAFEEFLQALELTDAEQEAASGQQTRLREALQRRMTLQDIFLSGSYRRNTAIRPLHDIDVFTVLQEGDGLGRDSDPQDVLRRIQEVLEEQWPGKTAEVQARSVNIAFTGTGIAYDVVPAFAEGDAVYVIPDRDTDAWIRTNPKVHAERSTAANEQAGKCLKPLLKALKHANCAHEKLCRSFHLEVLSWAALTSPPASYLDGFITLVEGIAARICMPCPDPAGLGPDIAPPRERCQQAQVWLHEVASLAREARTLAGDGKLAAAHAKLYAIFGAPWPERGSAERRRAGAVVVGGGGVDDGGSRFG